MTKLMNSIRYGLIAASVVFSILSSMVTITPHQNALASADDAVFRLEIWDEDLETTYTASFFYKDYQYSDCKWLNFTLPMIEVSGDFYVCFFYEGSDYYNFFIAYDETPPCSGHSYVAYKPNRVDKALNRSCGNPDESDWMIRVKGLDNEENMLEIAYDDGHKEGAWGMEGKGHAVLFTTSTNLTLTQVMVYGYAKRYGLNVPLLMLITPVIIVAVGIIITIKKRKKSHHDRKKGKFRPRSHQLDTKQPRAIPQIAPRRT